MYDKLINGSEKVKIKIEELKKIQLDILKDIDNFCKKNNIKYWLDYGTLIGAIRHSGYIPWDDDIDIGMLREDYDKFLKEYNKNNNQYQFISCENDKDYLFPFGKVIDTNTILYEPDENGIKIGVYVDIFVHDKASDNNLDNKKSYQKRDLYNKLRIAQIFPNLYDKTSLKKRLLRFFVNLYLKFLPKNYYTKKIIKNSMKYNNKDTSKIADFIAPYEVVVDKKIFDKTIDVTFEKNKYPAPIGYDEYLRTIYGDYMKLPPKEKRISNHNFKAYYKENDK